MSLDEAIRYTQILLGFAFLQQSLEHMRGARDEQMLFLPRIGLSLCLALGIWASGASLGLLLLALLVLRRFDGPYNGGSDRMGLLVLCCMTAAHFAPTGRLQEYAFGYLAAQLVLSYVISGWVKIVNPEWRKGRALRDVFAFSAYPVSETLRLWADRPRLLFAMAWAVMLFELFFPLALATKTTLIAALAIAALFHLANAFLFGLNRFFWTWLAAYPSILWLQQRLF